jgi:solute carrier family 26, other
MFSSFFSCAPISASLSRSLVQQGVGGKTQMASLVACALLLLVMLFIGPFFQTLPQVIFSTSL